MFPVFPVYRTSLCISKSTHAGALPGPTYPYFDNHASTEIHIVCMVPGPWVKAAGTVRSDSTHPVLSGHNTGMLIPHMSPVMDNILILVTLLSSTCRWPFASFKVKMEGQGVVGFFPAYAPFIYCDAPKEDAPSSDATQDKLASKGEVKLRTGAPARKFGPSNVKSKKIKKRLRAHYKPLTDKVDKARGGKKKGRGVIYVPTAKTVMMKFSILEILAGWAQVLITEAFNALAGAILKPLKFDSGRLLKRLDQDTARRVGEQAVRKAWKDTMSTKIEAAKELLRYTGMDFANKALFDGMLKAMILDGKVKMPYGLFSFHAGSGKGTFLKWGEFEGPAAPFEFDGARGALKREVAEVLYEPGVSAILGDNPNYAEAPEAPGAP